MVQKVQFAPIWSAVGGAIGLAAVAWLSGLSIAGWGTGLLYLAVSNALLVRGLRRHETTRFGPANAVTAVRSTLVALITALVATSFTAPIPVALLIGVTVPALALDAVDGWIARQTHTTSELGARFDMEVDAFLLLVLSAYVAPEVGWWAPIIGALRYAFVAVGWVLRWMTAILPPRYWRKVVTAVAGIGLTIIATGLLPYGASVIVTLVVLGLLVESFGRDVIWLFLQRRRWVSSRLAQR